MKGRYSRGIVGLVLTLIMITGVALVSASDVSAQRRGRVIIVRPIHRPFGWGYRGWWGYDPWSPYGSYYRQYVFGNSEDAVSQGYKDGFKTGKDDGKKAKSYDPERSHYYHDSGFGNFAEVYRSGFSRGYREGFSLGQNNRRLG